MSLPNGNSKLEETNLPTDEQMPGPTAGILEVESIKVITVEAPESKKDSKLPVVEATENQTPFDETIATLLAEVEELPTITETPAVKEEVAVADETPAAIEELPARGKKSFKKLKEAALPEEAKAAKEVKPRLGPGELLLKGFVYLLDKQIHFLVLGAAFIYLAYSWFGVQTKYNESQQNDFQSIIAIKSGDTTINFARDNGADRPQILTSSGDSILEYTDWGSKIVVNGQERNLWDTYHGYSVDTRNNRMVATASMDGWTLTQEVTLYPGNRARVEFYYRNDTATSDINLTLAHFRYNFIQPQIGTFGFESFASSRDVALADQDQNMRYKLSLKVNLENFPGGEVPVNITQTSQDKFGPTSISTVYNFRSLPQGQRILVASEDINWQPYNK